MSTTSRAKVAVLISGRGTNMQSIVTACANDQIPADVCCVVSNKARAPGLAFAASRGITTHVVNHRDFADRESFDAALCEVLDAHAPDWIVLAGFMRILTPVFIDHFHLRILNIHPSLLPLYPGLNTHARALAAGDAQHGASVHFVTCDLDAGPVIIQGIVDVETTDTPIALADRVLTLEHTISPEAVKWIASELITTDGKQCFYKGSAMIKPASWYNRALTYPVI
ncbi:MAG TPA: phosphoribosylglycinamide formyltransferase [Gammaproteobacteria bacterium]|nr:phosphoribosylglycinamide formyltransferase [Gammaproteobacteria bacterium]